MKQKLLFAALVLLALDTTTKTYAYDHDFTSVAPTGQTLYYKIVNGEAQVIYPYSDLNPYQGNNSWMYSENNGVLVIPSVVTYEGTSYAVTSIGYRTFDNCTRLTSVTIPNSVKLIDMSAFYGCTSLTSVTIPNGVVTIYGSAFANCTRLASVTIPESVTYIGDGAFYNCTGLITVNFNADSCGFMGHIYNANANQVPVFRGCSSLTTIKIGSNVKIIPSAAFASCTGLTSITIPQKVKWVGSGAFYYCTSLDTVNLNMDSCTSMGSSPSWCAGCSISTLRFGSNMKMIPNYALYNNRVMRSVVLPDSVVTIGSYAFAHMTSLESITIPSGVKIIEPGAFAGCSSLSSNIILDNVESIGYSAFPGCSSLTTVALGGRLKTIANETFKDCSSLVNISIPNNVTTIGQNAFYNCSSIGSITIPHGVTDIPAGCFAGCNHLTNLTLGRGVRTIAATAFGGCNAVLHLTVYVQTPPTSPSNPFAEFNTGIQVKVPCNSVSAYQNAPYWGFFTNISGEFEYSFSVTSSDINKGSVHIAAAPSCDSRQAEFSATPYQGYRFVRWSDGNTRSPRYLVVTQDTVLTAYFEANANGIEDVEAGAAVRLYPNPACGGATVRMEGLEGTATVQLMDLNGRELGRWTMTQESLTLDLQGVAQGAYLVRITAADGTATRKLIVR